MGRKRNVARDTWCDAAGAALVGPVELLKVVPCMMKQCESASGQPKAAWITGWSIASVVSLRTRSRRQIRGLMAQSRMRS